MIAEALDRITTLAVKSEQPPLLHEDDTKKVFFVGNGTLDVPIDVPPREHWVGALSEIIALANRFAGPDEPGESQPVVWYDEAKVVLVIDDGHHRVSTATLNLTLSDVFSRVLALRKAPGWVSQKAFIRLLRIDLAGTLDPGELLNHVQRVVFKTIGTASGTVTRAQESMGREINSRIEATTELPEVVTLRAPVYKTAGERRPYGLNCAVEIDHEQQQFQLLPLPDEIERVGQLALESIRERLQEELSEGVPSYYGRP